MDTYIHVFIGKPLKENNLKKKHFKLHFSILIMKNLYYLYRLKKTVIILADFGLNEMAPVQLKIKLFADSFIAFGSLSVVTKSFQFMN